MTAAPLRFSSVRAVTSRLNENRRHETLDQPRLVLNLVSDTKVGRLREVDLTEEQALALIEQTAGALAQIRKARR